MSNLTGTKLWTAPSTPYGRQPFKAAYIIYGLLRTAVLQPYWAMLHFLGLLPFPKSYSLKEALAIRSMQTLSRIVPNCNYHIDVIDYSAVTPEKLNSGKLVHTRAQWIPVPDNKSKWYQGIAIKEGCEPCQIVGVAWAKSGPPNNDLKVEKGEKIYLNLHGGGLAMGNATETDITAGKRKLVELSGPTMTR